MEILGLPGVKPATKKWMQDLLLPLSEYSFAPKIQEYRHWTDGSEADIDYEASCLIDIPVDLVIAKSLGTLISTYAFNAYHFRPQKAVFIGSPIRRHSSNHYQLLSRFAQSVPTLFIQQTSDFNGSYNELGSVVQNFPYASIAEVPGDDHIYCNIDELY